MTVREIYDSALKLIGVSSEGLNDSDYSERAPYIVAIFCDKMMDTDRYYREAHGLDAQNSFNAIRLELSAQFPLCDRFADSAIHYLASMLVLYENEVVHDKLFSMHCDLLSNLMREIPYYKEKIKNVYC